MAPVSSFVSAFATIATLLVPAVSAVPPIEVKGNEFIDSQTGNRFQMVGVAYQPGGSAGFDDETDVDPLSYPDVCLRDATIMQRLGINTVRIYNLNPSLDHNECASIYNAAGIYLVLDVNSPLPHQSLNREDPEETYHSEYMERVFAVIENFKNFPNVLGFFSGNEIINEDSVVEVPAYIRAVTRDMKDYIAKQAERDIPVGYSAADVRPMLENTANYLSCEIEDEPSSKIDFFGLNSYSWCGDSTFEEAGYDVLVKDFEKSAVPVFFSEYGCNEVTPRVFGEIEAVYSDQMTGVFSGGLIYEYTQEDNKYGLVELDGDDAQLLEDFDNLQTQLEKLDYNELQSVESADTNITPPKCSKDLLDGPAGNFSTEFTLPERPDGVDDMINNGIDDPNTGELVDVSNTEVQSTVTDTNGEVIEGLALNKLEDDESNTPSTAPSDGSGDDGSDQNAASPRSQIGNFLTLVTVAGVLCAVMGW